MKYPGFGVESSRGDVIRDLDLRTQARELVERSLLGAVGVGGRQDSQRLPCLTVPPEDIDQGPNAAPADEGHDEVDRVGEGGFRPELVPDRGLARRVGEDGRVEEWCQRPADRLRPPIR